jgi:hypothetical protein
VFLVAAVLLSALAVPLAGGRLGALADDPGFQSSAAVAEPRFAFLGDVFAIPASWPLGNVFSVGDVLIGAGLAWGLHRVCGSRLTPPWTPGQG